MFSQSESFNSGREEGKASWIKTRRMAAVRDMGEATRL